MWLAGLTCWLSVATAGCGSSKEQEQPALANWQLVNSPLANL